MNSALQVAAGAQSLVCPDMEGLRNSSSDGMFAAILEMLTGKKCVSDPSINIKSLLRGNEQNEPSAGYEDIFSVFKNKRAQLYVAELSCLPARTNDDIADQNEMQELLPEIKDLIAGYSSASDIIAATAITGQIDQAKELAAEGLSAVPEAIQTPIQTSAAQIINRQGQILFKPTQTPEIIVMESPKEKTAAKSNNKNGVPFIQTRDCGLQEKSKIDANISSNEADKQEEQTFNKKLKLQISPDKNELSQEKHKETENYTNTAEQKIVIEPIANPLEGKQLNISPKSIELPISRVAEELPEIIENEYQKINGPESSRGLIVQLEPKELGKMLVKLIKQDGVVSVKIFVEQQESKVLLDNSLTNLKQNFSELGVKYGRIDVEVASQFTGQNNQQPPNWLKEQRTQKVYNLNDAHNFCEHEEIRAVRLSGTNSSFDYFA